MPDYKFTDNAAQEDTDKDLRLWHIVGVLSERHEGILTHRTGNGKNAGRNLLDIINKVTVEKPLLKKLKARIKDKTPDNLSPEFAGIASDEAIYDTSGQAHKPEDCVKNLEESTPQAESQKHVFAVDPAFYERCVLRLLTSNPSNESNYPSLLDYESTQILFTKNEKYNNALNKGSTFNKKHGGIYFYSLMMLFHAECNNVDNIDASFEQSIVDSYKKSNDGKSPTSQQLTKLLQEANFDIFIKTIASIMRAHNQDKKLTSTTDQYSCPIGTKATLSTCLVNKTNLAPFPLSFKENRNEIDRLYLNYVFNKLSFNEKLELANTLYNGLTMLSFSNKKSARKTIDNFAKKYFPLLDSAAYSSVEIKNSENLMNVVPENEELEKLFEFSGELRTLLENNYKERIIADDSFQTYVKVNTYQDALGIQETINKIENQESMIFKSNIILSWRKDVLAQMQSEINAKVANYIKTRLNIKKRNSEEYKYDREAVVQHLQDNSYCEKEFNTFAISISKDGKIAKFIEKEIKKINEALNGTDAKFSEDEIKQLVKDYKQGFKEKIRTVLEDNSNDLPSYMKEILPVSNTSDEEQKIESEDDLNLDDISLDHMYDDYQNFVLNQGLSALEQESVLKDLKSSNKIEKNTPLYSALIDKENIKSFLENEKVAPLISDELVNKFASIVNQELNKDKQRFSGMFNTLTNNDAPTEQNVATPRKKSTSKLFTSLRSFKLKPIRGRRNSQSASNLPEFDDKNGKYSGPSI